MKINDNMQRIVPVNQQQEIKKYSTEDTEVKKVNKLDKTNTVKKEDVEKATGNNIDIMI